MLKLCKKLWEWWTYHLYLEYYIGDRNYEDHRALVVTMLARLFGGGLLWWVWDQTNEYFIGIRNSMIEGIKMFRASRE